MHLHEVGRHTSVITRKHVSDDRQTMLPGRCICLINNHEHCVSLFWCCLFCYYYTVELKLTLWFFFQYMRSLICENLLVCKVVDM